MTAADGLLLDVRDLARSFGETRALVAAELSILPGEIHALVGENGSGKTTLIKILSGVLRADEGRLHWHGEPIRFRSPRGAQAAGVATVFQETLVAPELTVRDNVFVGTDGLFVRTASRSGEEARCREVLEGLGIGHLALDRPLWSLSLAERQLVTIARALVRPWDLLILDEGTSALDADQRDRLFDYLRDARSRSKAVLFTSHRMDEVTALADSVSVLRLGRTVRRAAIGEISPREILSLMAVNEEVASAATERSRAARVRPQLGTALRADDIVLRRGAAPFSLEFGAGEIVGLAGLEGHGQVELAEVVAGIRRSAGGTVAVSDGGGSHRVRNARDARRRGIAYVPRDRKQEGLFFPLSILDNFSLALLGELTTFGILRRRAIRRRFREEADRLRLASNRWRELVGVLSGGNQQKVLLGRWLATRPRVLVLNDPLRGVDANTKEELYGVFQALADEGMAIVLVSTELLELLALSDRIAVFHRGSVEAVLDGPEATDRAIIAAMFGERETVAAS